jgi:Transmembrane family 220, helix
MAVLFAFAAAVQYNDPDPLQWMAMYGLAMLACGLALAGRLPRLLPALAGLGALVWAGTLAPGVVERVSLGELFQSYGMLSTAVEEGREWAACSSSPRGWECSPSCARAEPPRRPTARRPVRVDAPPARCFAGTRALRESRPAWGMPG